MSEEEFLYGYEDQEALDENIEDIFDDAEVGTCGLVLEYKRRTVDIDSETNWAISRIQESIHEDYGGDDTDFIEFNDKEETQIRKAIESACSRYTPYYCDPTGRYFHCYVKDEFSVDVQDPDVIFLDVDGVLNCRQFFREREEKGVDLKYFVRTKAVRVLSEFILNNPSVYLVISSTWRNHYDFVSAMKKDFASVLKIPEERILGRTGRKGSSRGEQISNWIENHKFEGNYAILDDDSDMIGHMDKLVKTSSEDGLQERHLEEIKRILNL